MITIIFNLNQSPCQIETETAHLCNLTSDILRAVDRGHDPRNGIWNDPLCPVMLSAYSRINLKVEDYKTKNKTAQLNTNEKKCVVSRSTSKCNCASKLTHKSENTFKTKQTKNPHVKMNKASSNYVLKTQLGRANMDAGKPEKAKESPTWKISSL